MERRVGKEGNRRNKPIRRICEIAKRSQIIEDNQGVCAAGVRIPIRPTGARRASSACGRRTAGMVCRQTKPNHPYRYSVFAKNSPSGSASHVLELAFALARIDACLSRSQSRDRNPIRRARYVIEAEAVADANTRRVAAMLAADAEFQLLVGLATAFDRDAHHAAAAFRIELLEGVLFIDAAHDVIVEEL